MLPPPSAGIANGDFTLTRFTPFLSVGGPMFRPHRWRNPRQDQVVGIPRLTHDREHPG